MPACLLLLLKFVIKDPRLFEAPKGDAPPPFWIRGLLVLTCTGVSFFHGSNDGQKGMGLIMLILIGTVPTAYALNHAVGYSQVQDFVAVSEQAAKVMSAHVDSNAVIDDPRADLTEYLQTKKQTPTTILAERQMILEIEHEVAPVQNAEGRALRSAAERAQRHVYLERGAAADGQVKEPGVHRGRSCGDGELQEEARSRHQVHSHLGQSGGGDRSGLGTMVGWKRIVVTVGEKIGKTHLTYGQGASAEIVAMFTILGGGQLRLAGQYHARAFLGRGRNHDGQQERTAVVYHPQHRCGLGLHFAGGGADVLPGCSGSLCSLLPRANQPKSAKTSEKRGASIL